MSTHVYANNNEIASKTSSGKSIAAFPDVCFSPPAPPAGPMPLPYPNTGECTNTDKGTSKVFIKDKMAGMEGDSCFSKSMGDEAATQNFNKGMITGALQGKCYFGLWSMDVQMEGKGVPRHLDMVTHNHASQPSNTTPFPNIGEVSVPTGIKEAYRNELNLFDKQFVVVFKDTGFPAKKHAYRIVREDGRFEDGITNEEGETHIVRGYSAEKIVICIKG